MQEVLVAQIGVSSTRFGNKVKITTVDNKEIYLALWNAIKWLEGKRVLIEERAQEDPNRPPYKQIVQLVH